MAGISARSQDCSPQGREAGRFLQQRERVGLGMCLGVPMSVHTGPSATGRTKPATVATSFADLNQPSEEQSLSAWLNNALIKRRQ